MAVVIPPVASPLVGNISDSAARLLAAGSRVAAPGLLFGSESVQVSLSGIAQRVLSQLTSDPTVNIDTAFARSVQDLAQLVTEENRLFSSNGLLQPFVPTPLLPQAPSSANGTVDVQAPVDTLLGAPPTAPVGEEALAELPITTTQSAETTGNEATPLAATNTAAPATAATTPADVPAPVATVATDTTTPQAAPVTTTTPVATPTGATPAGAPAPTTTPTTTTALDPSAIAAQNLADARNLDPFQQAALIVGLTSFGKEVNGFRVGAPNDDTVVQSLAAVRPVRERSDQSTEAWLQSRREGR